MRFDPKKIKAILMALTAWSAFSATVVWADPFTDVTPNESLYQRVKALGDAGLLDPQDQAVLDSGKIVTRLELAFYTEKAKARIEAPTLGEPIPTPQPVPTSVPVALPQPSPVAIPTAAPVPVATPYVNPTLEKEIDDLLNLLHPETLFLRNRLSLDDNRIKEQEDELDKLDKIQDEVDDIWKKANKSVGLPNFNTNIETRYESIGLSGIATENATRIVEQVWTGMYSDLGGYGAISAGVGAVVPYSNFSGTYSVLGVGTQPVSMYIGNPSASFFLNGDLGRWTATFAVEAYQPDTTLGDFSRGYANNSIKRFERPFDIKPFTDDKDAKNWDDFINSVSYVPAYSPTAGNVQSVSDRVFDGLYTVGKELPWLGPGGTMWLLVGRMGEFSNQTQRWEEAAKISQPWANNLLVTSISTEWVNDNFGINQPLTPVLDLKDYMADIRLNTDPFLVDLEAGFSHFDTGVAYPGAQYQQNNGNLQLDPNAIEAGAGQASLAFYPFTLYGFAISDSYADFQSKATMSGLNFFHYGMYFNPSDFQDAYGAIGEVDNLQSDRYGWRANLGWDGRKQEWMKDWPSFLDDIIINLDVSQKKEYVSEQSPLGYYVIEPTDILSFYYPDDEGLWGLNLWGNYSPNVNPIRQDYIDNIEAIRGDGDNVNDDVRYQFRMTSERLPLILPYISGSNMIVPAKGVTYTSLDDLKTYNYVTLTTKIKFDKWFDFPSPVYGTFFMTDNQVSGTSSNPALTGTADPNRPGGNLGNIPDLFQQWVFDGALMVNVVQGIDLVGDLGLETWRSQYTYPQVDYRTNVYGLGFAWDFPWGGGKMEFRYKHIDFHDTYVPGNDYSGDQFFDKIKFLF